MTGSARLPWALAAALALGACAPTLPSVPPLRAAPPTWTEGAGPVTPAVEDRWWLAFGDPILNGLVARADQADDPVIAEARLTEALARLGSARARLRPDASGTIDGESARIDDLEQDQLRGLLALAWAPDLNGAGRARTEAAGAQAAAEAARAAAALQATRATVVRLYIAYREGERRAAAAEGSVTALTGSLDLAASRERAGLVSALDPVSAQAQLSAARAQPIVAREAAETARLGLEALLGETPGGLRAVLEPGHAGAPTLDRASGLSAPLAVLARRPDLIAAERDLVAAGFEAEAARRDFWPTVSLSAALGGQAVDPETPSLVSGGLGQVTAGLVAPLWSFGRLEAARDGADARRVTAALVYRRAATQALAEVEQALVAARSADRRREALTEARAAGRDRVALASSRYRAGLTPLLEVLVAETALADSEAALASAEADAARAHAGLSVAMGLGAAAASTAEATGAF